MKTNGPFERGTIGGRLRPAKISILIRHRILQPIFAFLAFCSSALAENWEATLSKDPVGNFPELRPLRASYRFGWSRSEEHTSELQSQSNLVCRLLLEKKKKKQNKHKHNKQYTILR